LDHFYRILSFSFFFYAGGATNNFSKAWEGIAEEDTDDERACPTKHRFFAYFRGSSQIDSQLMS
jgi:hypothetical protein